MAAQDPDHSGEVYPIIISIPAQHDITCSAEAWMWSCLRVAQAEMSEYVIQYFNIEFCISSHCELQGVNRFTITYSNMPKLHFICVIVLSSDAIIILHILPFTFTYLPYVTIATLQVTSL